jgi:hypothetical protein
MEALHAVRYQKTATFLITVLRRLKKQLSSLILSCLRPTVYYRLIQTHVRVSSSPCHWKPLWTRKRFQSFTESEHNEVRGCIQKFSDWVIMKYKFTTINTRWEATQRVMAEKLTTLTHKIAMQLHLVAESCTICSSRSRWPVRKLVDTPSYMTMKWISNNWDTFSASSFVEKTSL